MRNTVLSVTVASVLSMAACASSPATMPGSGATDSGAGGRAGSGTSAKSLCSERKYLLCEGFETTEAGTVPPAGWTGVGDVRVVDDQAARGTRAMKIAAATKGPRRFVYDDAEAFGAAHWGRIFYKVATPVPTPFVHSTLVALEGDGPEIGVAEFRVVDTVKNPGANGYHQFLFNVQPSGAEFAKVSAYDWQFDGGWHCAEWFVDGGTQAYRFFFDGTELEQIQIANGAGNYGTSPNRTHLPAVFTDLRVGWNNYQAADPGFVAWIDEIAIDTGRIGCDG